MDVERIRIPALLVTGASGLAMAGGMVLAPEGALAVELWIGGVGAGCFGAGLAARRSPHASEDTALLLFTLAALLEDVAFGMVARGAWLAAGWTAAAVALGYFATRPQRQRHVRRVSAAGLGGHLFAGLIVAVGQPGQLAFLGHGAGRIGGTAAVMIVAAGTFAAGWVAGPANRAWRVALDTLGLALLVYLTATAITGPWLAVVWALQAVTLAKIARRTDDQGAAVAAVMFLSAAGVSAPVITAPGGALTVGLPDPADCARMIGPTLAGLRGVAR